MTLIKSLLIFYPLIIPVWEQGPFDSRNIARVPEANGGDVPGHLGDIVTPASHALTGFPQAVR